MNTQHLKFAVEIAKIGSITEAANALYMSQPQLSKLILDMERSLGFPIFKRSARGVVPTSKGEKFLAHARNILEQVDIIEHLYRPDDRKPVQRRHGWKAALFGFGAPRQLYCRHILRLSVKGEI